MKFVLTDNRVRHQVKPLLEDGSLRRMIEEGEVWKMLFNAKTLRWTDIKRTKPVCYFRAAGGGFQ